MTPKLVVVDKGHITTIMCLRKGRWLCTHVEVREQGTSAPLENIV